MSADPIDTSKTHLLTYDDLAKHSTKEDLYILIAGKVYDVTKFVEEHPGGDEVILSEANTDATNAFEDIGHSDEARAQLAPLLVGHFDKTSKPVKSLNVAPATSKLASSSRTSSSSAILSYIIPAILLAAYAVWRVMQ